MEKNQNKMPKKKHETIHSIQRGKNNAKFPKTNWEKEQSKLTEKNWDKKKFKMLKKQFV